MLALPNIRKARLSLKLKNKEALQKLMLAKQKLIKTKEKLTKDGLSTMKEGISLPLIKEMENEN